MAIKDILKSEFIKVLNLHVSASAPVRESERLLGRDREKDEIDEALSSVGRNIFIYGDRGVGKTSLATATAMIFMACEDPPVQIGCVPDTTFYQTIEDLTKEMIENFIGETKYTIEHEINTKIYRVKWKKENITFPEVSSMSNAIKALRTASTLYSSTPVVVIDEFDQIKSDNERSQFASFLKAIGDKCSNIKFIITGVSTSLFKLLGDHASSGRQLHTMELKRLNWDAREDIVKNAARAFNLTIDRNIPYHISKISNGFPYFVHLITEKLLWTVFRKEDLITKITSEHFIEAVNKAISSISAQLERPYNLATLHRNNDYREILWATADSESYIRYTDHMFKSYLRIHEKVAAANRNYPLPLPKEKFVKRIGNLKKEKYGQILENSSGRRGLYSYRENILRGYVAMKAFEAGIELQGDIPDEPKVPTAMGREKRQYSVGIDWTPKKIKFRGED